MKVAKKKEASEIGGEFERIKNPWEIPKIFKKQKQKKIERKKEIKKEVKEIKKVRITLEKR